MTRIDEALTYARVMSEHLQPLDDAAGCPEPIVRGVNIWHSLFAPALALAPAHRGVPHYDHVMIRASTGMSLEHGRDRVAAVMAVLELDAERGVQS